MEIEGYKIPWLANLFHSFPHLDLTFKYINSTFNPESSHYREVLVFWAAVPVLWLLLTLISFLIYFCYRCCQRDVEKKQRVPCLKWTMATLAVFTCGIIGVGIYGNEETNKGIKEFSSSISDVDVTIWQMKKEVNHMQSSVNETIDGGINDLQKLFRRHRSLNSTFKDRLVHMTNNALNYAQSIVANVETIDTRAQHVNLTNIKNFTDFYGFYRWLAILLLLSWKILLCLLLLIGIGKTSKCTLLMFCAFGIFTLVLCWLSAGLHLGVSVGLGDFCVSPNTFIKSLKTSNVFDQDIINYYLECDSQTKNPFSQGLKAALDSVTSTNLTIVSASLLAQRNMGPSTMQPYVREISKGLDNTVTSIQKLTALVDCKNLHSDYLDAVNAVCHVSLPGIVFILISAVITGLLFTLLVVMASRAWRHFGKRKGYMEVDEDDPFLPRPDNSASPSYYSFTRGGRQGNPREQIASMNRRSSPPPAYNTNEFYRQHGYNPNQVDSRPPPLNLEITDT